MTLETTRMSLLDVARRLDPDGKAATIAEIMNHFNEILDDIPFVEGNTETGNKTTVRGALPTPAFRLINQGVTRTKSTTKQIMESCGTMEAYSEIDVKLARMARDPQAFRLGEDKAHIEGMSQLAASTLIYGDTSVNPDRFVGLVPRYYSLATTVSTYGQIIDAGGTSNLTSVWLVGWAPDCVHGIFPKGSKAGLIQQDLGEVTTYDSSGNPFQAYRTHFSWDLGLCVRDYRYVVRIANIDQTALLTAGDANDSSTNLLKYMSMAIDLIPPAQSSRLVFYCNNKVRAMLRVKMQNKSNVYITADQIDSPILGFKRPTLFYQGIPVRRIDEITNSETRVTT